MSTTSPSASSLVVIIPALNEAAHLDATIQSAQTQPSAHIIVADGGSEDDTVSRAKDLGASVISAPCGRGSQMNAAVHAAANDIPDAQTLLFLHADTLLPPDYANHVQAALAQPNVVAGAFRLRIRPSNRRLQLIAAAANARSRFFQLPYGDQALFLPAATFNALGGYANWKVMEDVDFVRRLKKTGRIALTTAHVVTSARRYTQRGPLRLALIHQLMLAGYYLGVSPDRLARWRNTATGDIKEQ